MNKTFGIVLIFIVIVVGGFLFLNNSDAPVEEMSPSADGEEKETDNNPTTPTKIAATVETATVQMLDSGFEPKELTITQGTIVRFINKGSTKHWPASAIHPTHRVYPNTDIKNCSTAEDGQMFDACRGLEPGEEWSFQFNEIGTWNYHNHRRASLTGKIIVE